jgi:hypothetical protein
VVTTTVMRDLGAPQDNIKQHHGFHVENDKKGGEQPTGKMLFNRLG